MTIRKSGPVLLLSSGSLFHLPLEQVATMAAQSGFAGLELIVNDPALQPGPAIDAVNAVCPIHSLHAPFRQWSRWGGHQNSWKATTALANALPHCDHITLHPPGNRLSTMIQNRWFARAHDLALLLDAKGRLRYSLENLPWAEASPFGRDELDKLMDQCRKKNVGMTFDVCHMGVSGYDVLNALDRVPHDLLCNVHFSDARAYREHMTPGTGDLPLDDFLARLDQRGYQGYVTLELEPAAFPEQEDKITAMLRDIRSHMEESMNNG
ncbi:sugar phosphate isomerase/epimerase family protein [Pseudodesulfovibrio senegalensis]|uniref:Sugar phosphate isomerase/epimerase n=1 Tax=Pseudodesulfovibrio senegalensis TaxID=1721087 RepID=A0A6N6N3G0_9BACT|nr:sugar phosphate isomerase/epimerase [Pseudodesulfovibrio senegalensis]KAB1441609.1 sugar phosphate isomerase/epimerase [Pseudodesulfovibrio senegalensis]